MQSAAQTVSASKKALRAGGVLSAIPVVFLILDGIMKAVKAPVFVTATIQLGYPQSTVREIGVVLLVCTLLYVFSRTSILGAILLTGYLGGAVATHLRHDDPLFSHVLFPVYVGVMLWGGLFLREHPLRVLFPYEVSSHCSSKPIRE